MLVIVTTSLLVLVVATSDVDVGAVVEGTSLVVVVSGCSVVVVAVSVSVVTGSLVVGSGLDVTEGSSVAGDDMVVVLDPPELRGIDVVGGKDCFVDVSGSSSDGAVAEDFGGEFVVKVSFAGFSVAESIGLGDSINDARRTGSSGAAYLAF